MSSILKTDKLKRLHNFAPFIKNWQVGLHISGCPLTNCTVAEKYLVTSKISILVYSLDLKIGVRTYRVNYVLNPSSYQMHHTIIARSGEPKFALLVYPHDTN